MERLPEGVLERFRARAGPELDHAPGDCTASGVDPDERHRQTDRDQNLEHQDELAGEVELTAGEEDQTGDDEASRGDEPTEQDRRKNSPRRATRPHPASDGQDRHDRGGRHLYQSAQGVHHWEHRRVGDAERIRRTRRAPTGAVECRFHGQDGRHGKDHEHRGNGHDGDPLSPSGEGPRRIGQEDIGEQDRGNRGKRHVQHFHLVGQVAEDHQSRHRRPRSASAGSRCGCPVDVAPSASRK